MHTPFTGAWVSIRSNIPDYEPGNEWLHFTESDTHVWKVGQPGGHGKPSITCFTLTGGPVEFEFCAVGVGKSGWRNRMERISATELAVTPRHGFTTVFSLLEVIYARATDAEVLQRRDELVCGGVSGLSRAQFNTACGR